MRILLILISIVVTNVLFSQISWSSSIEDLGDEKYEVTMHADLEDHWHLYSQKLKMLDEGPLSTYISFNQTEGFELVGETTESEPIVEYDEIWKADIAYFEGSADFKQVFKRTDLSKDTIYGNVNYMICEDGACMPPDDYYFTISVELGDEVIQDIVEKTDSLTLSVIPELPNLNLKAPVNSCGEGDVEDKGFLTIFLLGLVAGLASLITPCVFPMIPLTVSFFTKGGQDKNGVFKAMLYGVSIVAVYVSLSIPFYFNVDGSVLQEIASGVILNVVFFLIFMFFAFSFFGFYEIGLPASWANKMDQKADGGGFFGIIFMAVVLAIVSFSCTGPLLGTVLAGSLTKGAFPITLAMAGFGIGLGLPFSIFAAFPSLLKSLPQSGGWLNSVKVVLGFVEVALAFKFLSTADLVGDWNILKYELFLAIWILCALGTSLYLFGVIKFPHDSPIKKLGKLRVIFAVAFAVLTVYYALGFRINDRINSYQSLYLMSGVAPPVGYSWLYPLDGPNGLKTYHSFEDAQKVAKELNKPLLVDFTGNACTNCRRMEDNVWSDPSVFNMINDDYVLVSLYVDDATELPEHLQGEINIKLGNGKTRQQKVVTYGNKWSTFEQLRFGKLTQPYYVLLSPDGYLLNNPVGYTPEVIEYADWLSCGLDAFEKLNDGKVDTKTIEETKSEDPVEVEVLEPVKWSFSAVPTEQEGVYDLKMEGLLSSGWHTYSQFLTSMEGPLPTLIQYNENDSYELVGEALEPDVHSVYDDVWEMEILQFENTATFVQKVKINTLPATISGTVLYMACDEGKCVNLDEAFEVVVK